MKFLLILKRFLKRIQEKQPVVIFDIGSASIGGAVVFPGKEVPRISYCTRIYLPFPEKADKQHLLPQIEEVLSQVVGRVQKEGLRSKGKESMVPKEIVCVLSSLWSNTRTTSASFEHKERFVVTDNIMDNLLAQIHKTNEEDKEDTTVTIEEVVVNSLLNGYPTRFPLGKRAQRIDVSFLESTVAKSLHEKMDDVIYKVFSPDIPLLLRSFTLVGFSVTRDVFDDVKDFILIDVTGEITEISVVRDSALEDTLSFPYGRNTIVRDIAKKTKSVPEDVLARVRLALADEGASMREDLAEEEKQWTKMFGKACGELSSDTRPLPQKVFLVADAGYGKWFRSMIERVDFSQFTVTHEVFQVNTLTGSQIKEACTLDDKATRDSFLSIASLFYNREYLSRRPE